MKILHTSDWHLGKTLDSFYRIEEQIQFLEELTTIVNEQKIDVVVVAGDLFDSFNPPAKAVEVFYKYLKKISNNGKRCILAIAGNHDSPERIEAPDPLARECGIIFIGYPNSKIEPFQLDSGLEIVQSDYGFIELKIPKCKYPLRVIHSPYTNEVRLKKFLPKENEEYEFRSYVESKWKELADKYCNENGVNLLVAHLYVENKTGEKPIESDSEKPIVGLNGAERIYSENIPNQIQYVALGHLHRYQSVSENPCPIVYSGSPIAYSLSESEQPKYINIVELKPTKKASYQKIKILSGLVVKRKTFSDIDEAVEFLSQNQNCYIELTIITDTYLSGEIIKRLHQSHPRILSIIPEMNKELLDSSDTMTKNIDMSKSVEDLFLDYYSYRRGGLKPSESVLNILKEAIAVEEKL